MTAFVLNSLRHFILDIRKTISRRLVREILISFGFVLLTSVMTWPWVTHLRDACADPGDPYLHSWVMWWDYHQTFSDPLRLFHGNIFYPLSYTLAFTEHDYGIALFFFPLYAIGLRPLTVLSIATFLGFAFSGYGAFRLARTLTGSTSAACIAGIAFAFAPFRFHVLSQVTYVVAGWIPLLLEALILFARKRTWRRAIWLSVAFSMNGLTCLTWMSLSLVPLVLSAALLIAIHQLWRDRDFWIRGAAAAGGSLLVLFPFLLPYLRVSRMYGFVWGDDIVQQNSPTFWNWLAVEDRVRLWKNVSHRIGIKGARLFPGIITPLLAAASLLVRPLKPAGPATLRESVRPLLARALTLLDAVSLSSGLFVAGSLIFAGSQYWKFLGRVFSGPTLTRSVVVLLSSVLLRLMILYAVRLRQVLETIGAHFAAIDRSPLREAFWLGWIWTIVGFLLSLGTNSAMFRVLFRYVLIFRSMREPSRAAMIAVLGLSLLAGVGVVALTRMVSRARTATILTVIVGALLLLDVHVAPLNLTRGAADPDELAIWLKGRTIRGGLVELPTATGVLPHLYMLRAADHQKPLVNAIAAFLPRHVIEINDLSRETPISTKLLDALERIPTSYLIIHNDLLEPTRVPIYESFLGRGIASNRLRFIRRLGAADVYALTKVEPEARIEQSEGPSFSPRDWATSIAENPDNLAGLHLPWSERLYRLNLVAAGQLPRYQDFVHQAKQIGKGLFAGDEEQFRERERELARHLAQQYFSHLSDDEFLDRVLINSRLNVTLDERERFKASLSAASEARPSLLLALAADARVIEKEKERSLVLVHFFAYLRRNPDDPPDKDLSGFDFWVREVRKHGGVDLATAFSRSIERGKIKQ